MEDYKKETSKKILKMRAARAEDILNFIKEHFPSVQESPAKQGHASVPTVQDRPEVLDAEYVNEERFKRWKERQREVQSAAILGAPIEELDLYSCMLNDEDLEALKVFINEKYAKKKKTQDGQSGTPEYLKKQETKPACTQKKISARRSSPDGSIFEPAHPGQNEKYKPRTLQKREQLSNQRLHRDLKPMQSADRVKISYKEQRAKYELLQKLCKEKRDRALKCSRTPLTGPKSLSMERKETTSENAAIPRWQNEKREQLSKQMLHRDLKPMEPADYLKIPSADRRAKYELLEKLCKEKRDEAAKCSRTPLTGPKTLTMKRKGTTSENTTIVSWQKDADQLFHPKPMKYRGMIPSAERRAENELMQKTSKEIRDRPPKCSRTPLTGPKTLTMEKKGTTSENPAIPRWQKCADQAFLSKPPSSRDYGKTPCVAEQRRRSTQRQENLRDNIQRRIEALDAARQESLKKVAELQQYFNIIV